MRMRSSAALAISTFTLTLSVLIVEVGLETSASAQLLNASRCRSESGISEAQAQARYAWALYCRSNPTAGPGNVQRPGTHWLSDESLIDYDAAVNATLRPKLFPAYFELASAAPWDVPDGSVSCALLPASAINVGLCVASCYSADTPLRFADGEMGIKAAAESGRLDLVTLAPQSTLDALTTTHNQVERYTVDSRDSWETLYHLMMRSGGTLRVTSEHPLLTSDGMMRQARTLSVGSSLVRQDGAADPIVTIQVKKEFGKVYNVRPVTTDYTSNIVVAGGYLSGSLRYQSEFLDTINAVILRRSLAAQAD